MIYALRDCFAGTGYGYCTFCRIRQHLRSNLNRCASDLADLLDLGATLADQGTALRSRYDQSQCNRWPRDTTAASGAATLNVVKLRAPFLKFLAYQRERLEDGVRRPGDCHYSLRAGTIGDVDFRARLRRANGKLLSIINFRIHV